MARKKNENPVRKPSESYNSCPSCKSKDLIRLEVDVLCGNCDWMSCKEYVDSGGMDNFFKAFREHFPDALTPTHAESQESQIENEKQTA